MVGKYLGRSQRPVARFWRRCKLALASYQRLGSLCTYSVWPCCPPVLVACSSRCLGSSFSPIQLSNSISFENNLANTKKQISPMGHHNTFQNRDLRWGNEKIGGGSLWRTKWKNILFAYIEWISGSKRTQNFCQWNDKEVCFQTTRFESWCRKHWLDLKVLIQGPVLPLIVCWPFVLSLKFSKWLIGHLGAMLRI